MGIDDVAGSCFRQEFAECPLVARRDTHDLDSRKSPREQRLLTTASPDLGDRRDTCMYRHALGMKQRESIATSAPASSTAFIGLYVAALGSDPRAALS